MVVVLACPSWCVVHRGPDPDEPGHGGAHYGHELSVPIEEIVEVGVEVRIFVQMNAHDMDGQRHTVIDLVDPHGYNAELTVAEARAVADILVRGADLWSVTPLTAGVCPPWCVSHTSPDVVDIDDAIIHRSEPMTVVASGPTLSGFPIEVEMCVLDREDGRELDLVVSLGGTRTGVTSAEACKIAAHLLSAADLVATDRV